MEKEGTIVTGKESVRSCVKCEKELSADALYCPYCGKKQAATKKRVSKRANGEGSVYRRKNGTWIAVKVFGYEIDENDVHRPIRVSKSGFKTKKEALEYLPKLAPKSRTQGKGINRNITFKELFDLWLPTHERKGRDKSTINCYKAAMKHYKSIWSIPFAELGIDDLQECIDDCPCGKRTRENMKALGTLLYSYAIPRGYAPEKVDLAHYLFVGGKPGEPREEFTADEIEIVHKAIGVVPYADYIYCQIYLGFRPHEFLILDVANYNRKEHCFVGGIKTPAGIDRSVTVSPKIQYIIDRLTEGKASGPVFCDLDGKRIPDKKYREDYFYPALMQMGLPLPGPGDKERKLTPHCCRHTFATLMKTVEAPDKDKLELMGHTSTEMLRHYQHTNFDDLRNITNQL